MICDKCGKSNISAASKCSYCGADMPAITSCGGFADILSFQGSSGADVMPKSPDNKMEGMSESDMQKLLKKSDNIMVSTRKNLLFGIIAVGLSLLILISSIIIGMMTISTVKDYKEQTMTQLEQTNEKLEEYKDQVEAVIKEKGSSNKTTKKTTTNSVKEDDKKDEEEKKVTTEEATLKDEKEFSVEKDEKDSDSSLDVFEKAKNNDNNETEE